MNSLSLLLEAIENGNFEAIKEFLMGMGQWSIDDFLKNDPQAMELLGIELDVDGDFVKLTEDNE